LGVQDRAQTRANQSGAAVASALLSTVAGRVLMPAGDISLLDAITWRTAFVHAAYLVLLTVLCTGAAFLLRSPAAGLGVLIPLTLLGTMLATAIPGVAELGGFMPDSAVQRGTRIQAREDYELDPWTGLIVMVGWAFAAAAAGAWRFRRRDA
jgi:ABC-2 type transport system permease protein